MTKSLELPMSFISNLSEVFSLIHALIKPIERSDLK